ncbi:hypothetical protein JL720_7514 [Aureococcus anophagefferens]|nr:hypothetical protein JL720_7514 [Aureococcus anophagefferens]
MASFTRVVDGGDEEAPWPSEAREAQLLAKLRENIDTVIIPTNGGRLLEPMSDERLMRFLGARKHDVAEAARLYRDYWKCRVATFGAERLDACDGDDGFLRLLCDDARDAKGRPRLLLDLARLDLGDDLLDAPGKMAPLLGRVWSVVDAALGRGREAVQHGLVLQLEGITVPGADDAPTAPTTARRAPAAPETVSRDRVDAIVAELNAGHVPEPPDILDWTEDAAFMYYATDGEVKPGPAGGALQNPVANPPNRRCSGCIGRQRMQREYFL